MRFVIGSCIVVAVLAIAGYVVMPATSDQINGQDLVFYSANRADLPIVVTERGYLESQEQTTIRCMVETYDRRSGMSGSTILSLVPNGSLVEKGEILAELDSAAIRDLLESESLELESDRSTLRQAQARKQNRLTQNETALAEAELSLKLAELNRKMYIDPESGSFKLSVSEIDRQIDEARNAILEAQAALKLQETEKDGIEQLFQLGYKGRSDLEQSRYSFMKSEAALASSMNRLADIEASKKQLESYARQMELMRLDGEVETAKRSLNQVQVTNESELAQVEAQLFEAQERVRRQESRLAYYERQLEYCTIRAPHDGMVVYAQNNDGGSSVGVGREVRSRQHLFSLPDLSRMQVRLKIHEAVLDQVEPGMAVALTVDAFANEAYQGVVDHVAVVPSPGSRSVKTYECTVTIPDLVTKLKPGMTAVAQILVDQLEGVISVPVQSIVQMEGETWCYLQGTEGVRKQSVFLGQNNDKFVEVVDGISEMDQVVLNPMVIANLEQRKKKNEVSPSNARTAGMMDQLRTNRKSSLVTSTDDEAEAEDQNSA